MLKTIVDLKNIKCHYFVAGASIIDTYLTFEREKCAMNPSARYVPEYWKLPFS